MLIIYIFLLIIFTFVTRNINKKNGFTGAFSGFSFSLILYYIVVPIILFFIESNYRTMNEYGFSQVVSLVYNIDFNYQLTTILQVVIGFSFFVLAYKYGAPKLIEDSNFVKINITNNNLKYLFRYLSIFSWLIGFVSILGFTILVGGPLNALALAEQTRGFEISVAQINYFAGIFKLFSRFITVAAVSNLIMVKFTKSLLYKFLFVTSFILSIYYYLTNAGRTPLFTFLIIFVYLFLEKVSTRPWKIIILLGIIFLPVVNIASSIFVFFQTGEFIVEGTDVASLVRQFISPHMQLLNIEEIVNIFGYQYFIPLFTDILDILPGLSFQPSYAAPSAFFNGFNWRMIGGVPNDILSYGYLQFGYIGIIVISYIWGIFMRYFDKMILQIQDLEIRKIVSVSISTQVFQIVFAADIGPIIMTNLIIMMYLFIFLLQSSLNKYNKKMVGV